MFATLLQAAFAFILTGVIGGRIAHLWQARSAREARFFDASKDMYDQMVTAADDLSSMIGKRIYASQRVCLISKDAPAFTGALANYQAVIIEWNERLLSLELAIRTKFRHASLSDFEYLQGRLVAATLLVNNHVLNKSKLPAKF